MKLTPPKTRSIKIKSSDMPSVDLEEFAKAIGAEPISGEEAINIFQGRNKGHNKSMKIERSKEWWLKRAEQEGDSVVTTGLPDPDYVAKLEQLFQEGKASGDILDMKFDIEKGTSLNDFAKVVYETLTGIRKTEPIDKSKL